MNSYKYCQEWALSFPGIWSFHVCWNAGIRQKQVGGNKMAKGSMNQWPLWHHKGFICRHYGLSCQFWKATHPTECSFLTLYHHLKKKIYIYISEMNLLSHGSFNATFSSPVCLSPSVSPLLCCPPPYPAEIRLYWQSFPAPNTWRLNLSFNSCDITEHPPSHLICFFPCVYTLAGGPLAPCTHCRIITSSGWRGCSQWIHQARSLALPLRRVSLVFSSSSGIQ